ncbi:MAG: sugar transferase [Gemmatimonadaceae bacterium]|nr:sugar transferase [Gemmatimonadaceae bacterium]
MQERLGTQLEEIATEQSESAGPRIERLAVGPDGIPEISAEYAVFSDSTPLPTPLVASGATEPVRTYEALQLVREAIREIDEVSAADGAATEAQASPRDETEMRWPFVDRRERPRTRDNLERAVNVAIAGLGLLVAAPVMLLVAIAIKLDSRGPVLYKQERVGRDQRRGRERRRHPFGPRTDRRKQNFTGRVFTIYKFRSMCVDAEANCGAKWATRNDPRVTRLGRFLRASRLDELPQLWNVLRGDMNIVGPRPERPTIIVDLVRDIREYPARHRTRPGITGWAQINAAYDTSLEDVRRKVRYDLEYLEQRSLTTDLRIMAKTVPVMIAKQLGW